MSFFDKVKLVGQNKLKKRSKTQRNIITRKIVL